LPLGPAQVTGAILAHEVLYAVAIYALG